MYDAFKQFINEQYPVVFSQVILTENMMKLESTYSTGQTEIISDR